MFGLGFLNSVFLFALGATVLPVVIHILNRRRIRRVPFSSLEFIYEMSRRRMSKVNLRRWIILILRTLAVAFLVFGFARPTLRSAAMFMPGQVPKNVVLCVDVSGSMGAELETGTMLDRARDMARRLLDQSGRNDVLNLVAFSNRAEVLFENGTRNRQLIKNALDDLRAGAETTQISRAVEAALGLVDRSEVEGGEIYVISDFREPADSAVTRELPDGVSLVLLPVHREAIDNASIDRVLTPRKIVRPGEVVNVGVALTNHSRENPASFPLELLVGTERKAEKLVELSPASSAHVTFSVSLSEWGTHRCRVSKNRDRLPIDDDRFFLIEVSRRIPVTLVGGRRSTEDAVQSAQFYIEKALNPRGSDQGEFAVTSVDEGELTLTHLPEQGVVVWTEPRDPGERRFQILRQYVEAGGAAMVLLGHDPQGFWRDAKFRRYLGIESARPRETAEGEHLVSFSREHPAFSLFNEEELELLSRSRITRFVSVTGVRPDSVIAYMSGGSPAVWECARGKGRLLVVAAAPDTRSGDLPLSPMFLPLLHTSVSYLSNVGASDFHRENHAGSDLVFDVPAAWETSSGPWRVVDDGGEVTKPLLFESTQGEKKALVGRPRRIGFYRLEADTAVVAEAAVNMDTGESNLNPQPLERDQIGAARVLEASGDLAADLESARAGREVYAFFLLLAISALVLESILGRRA